ncbi:hypothetical protein KI387_041713, partial [Taxus chinensis]
SYPQGNIRDTMFADSQIRWVRPFKWRRRILNAGESRQFDPPSRIMDNFLL